MRHDQALYAGYQHFERELILAKNVRLNVRLGKPEWAKHTYDRSDTESKLELLGSVQKGQQRGALAQREDGDFVMLVGDFEMPLNQSQIRKALVSANADLRGGAWTPPPPPSTTVPVVHIKKRRVYTVDK